jgi:predicted transport protein
MSIIVNGKRLELSRYKTENIFEDDVVAASKLLFGEKTIYINAKKKIESKSLGGVIPDGFFFDFSDPTDPQFYIVEVELSEHSFFNHIFPQITKFFAFFKNNKLQKSLVDKLFTIVDNDNQIHIEFKKYLGKTEVYKFLSDILESSQNILLVSDGIISELPEIMDTYTDTWGKMVRFIEVKKYVNENDIVYSIIPDFEIIQLTESEIDIEEKTEGTEQLKYTEQFHLDDALQIVKDIYAKIKESSIAIDPQFVFNPQKYYISIKKKKSLAFIQIRKKKIRIIAMLPEEEIRKIILKHPVIGLSEGVQKFYNGKCAAIDIINLNHFDEIEEILHRLV